MTEDGAKAKWCPFARTPRNDNAGATNRGTDGSFGYVLHTCVAADCMAWRWTVTPELAAAFTKARAENPKSEGPTEADGYCGLAGNR